MQDYNNTFLRADKKFEKAVYDFLQKTNDSFTMMEIAKMANLSKTQVSLSLEQLIKDNKVDCIQKRDKNNLKKFYTIKKQ